MRRPLGTFWALALLSVPLLAAVAPAQTLDPPGSDRAGKARGADAPPPEPTPAAGTRLGREPADVPVGAVGAPAAGRAAAPAMPPVLSSHQIDRYDALQKEQEAVKANPRSVADWIILGEIAHEVAMDAPAAQAGQYFTLSRDAFEKALALQPNNAGLKAAVQFARDQQAHVDAFEKSRDAVTDTFLNARRRDLAATRYTPSVRTFAPPLPSRELPGPDPNAGAAAPAVAGADPAVTSTAVAVTPAPPATTVRRLPASERAPAITPAREGASSTDTANYGTRQNYSAAATAGPTVYTGPVYRPFASPDGAPYTYQQYNRSYFPAGLYDNPAVPPVTAQRYAPPVVQPVPNALERQILNRTTPALPR